MLQVTPSSLLTTISDSCFCSCKKEGIYRQRLPTSTPRNLFVHVQELTLGSQHIHWAPTHVRKVYTTHQPQTSPADSMGRGHKSIHLHSNKKVLSRQTPWLGKLDVQNLYSNISLQKLLHMHGCHSVCKVHQNTSRVQSQFRTHAFHTTKKNCKLQKTDGFF